MSENQPAARFRIGSVTATIWKNENEGGNTFYSTTVSRSYKDGDDWKQADNFNHGDLLNAAKPDVIPAKADIGLECDLLAACRRSCLPDFTAGADRGTNKGVRPTMPVAGLTSAGCRGALSPVRRRLSG